MNQVRHYRNHHLLLLPGSWSVISTAAAPGVLLGCLHCTVPHRTRGRQRSAFAVVALAGIVLLAAALSAGAFLALRNPALFTFRPGGTGASAGTQSDQQFIQSQASKRAASGPAKEVSRRSVDGHPAPG